jgi:hypothetical protein
MLAHGEDRVKSRARIVLGVLISGNTGANDTHESPETACTMARVGSSRAMTAVRERACVLVAGMAELFTVLAFSLTEGSSFSVLILAVYGCIYTLEVFKRFNRYHHRLLM